MPLPTLLRRALSAALATLLIAGTASATVIDFTHADATTIDDGSIVYFQRIGDVSFSKDIYGDGWFDGFSPLGVNSILPAGGAWNPVGENHEFMQWGTPAHLDSIDARFLRTGEIGNGLAVPTLLTFSSFNAAGTLLKDVSVVLSADFQTVRIDQAGVSKLEISFTGGTPEYTYHSSRPNSWYVIDNVTFNTAPEPGSAATLAAALALAGAGALRRRL